MKCTHPTTSVGFALDYSFARDGYLLDACGQCGRWRYINHPTDRSWHPASEKPSKETAKP